MEYQTVIMSALSDPTRFKILRFLLERDLCVGALARELAISEPAVSQHLKKLRQCGLVRGEKRGYWVHYYVNTDILIQTADELKSLAELKRTDTDECCKRNAGGKCCCSARKSDDGLQELSLATHSENRNEPK